MINRLPMRANLIWYMLFSLAMPTGIGLCRNTGEGLKGQPSMIPLRLGVQETKVERSASLGLEKADCRKEGLPG